MRKGWKIFEPAVSYEDRAEIWTAVAKARAAKGDNEGARRALWVREENRRLAS